MRRFALYLVRWLVRHRVALFVGTLAVAAWCAFLIPHININSDMTRYLPDSYAMKQGMVILDTELSGIQEQAQAYTSPLADGVDKLPQGLGKTIIIGVALVFAVLLIMSSSVLEVVVFLITIGTAVLINVGTNALLPSVSLTTNTISPVLQMVLSMDYCIILMNRYRDERSRGKLKVASMNLAVGGTGTTILSSAFTTVVSLLMLCFIKLKIGTDLGVVLAKGVVISLICNFTLLPALVIWFSKALEASRKKVPVLPAAPLARFQYRFRIPITILFVGAAVAFTLLQFRTPLFFAAPKWEGSYTPQEEPMNPMLLVYSNSDESAVTPLLDSIALDGHVKACISYPTIADKPRTPAEMAQLFRTFSGRDIPGMTGELLDLVYYAHDHPDRDERFSLNDLKQSSDSLRKTGLIPPDKDVDFEKLIRKAVSKSFSGPLVTPKKVVEKQEVPKTVEEKVVAPEDSAEVHVPQEAEEVSVAEAPAVTAVPEGPTYEEITSQMTAPELAEFMGTNPRQVSMLYRMAGKRGGTMSPVEFIRYVRNNILGKKRYAAFLPKGTDEQMARTEELYQSILAAGGTPVTEPVPEPSPDLPGPADSDAVPSVDPVEVPVPADTIAVLPEPTVAQVVTPEVKSKKPVRKEVYTSLDELVDMYLSGRKYPSSRVCRVLRRNGVPVSQGEMDLLFLYTASLQDTSERSRISPANLLDYLADTLLVSPEFSGMVPDSARGLVVQARDSLLSGVGILRGKNYSAAAVLTGYEVESPSSFAFVDKLRTMADSFLGHGHFWVGESEMYKELKDGFPQELLLLTLLTVLSIFLIVALNFRSLLIPVPLIMTVLAGIYANVWASGLGGRSMYYLSYLIVQGILMGATIDYSILFTSNYLSARRFAPPKESLESAYRTSSHSILTSGVILALVPLAMSLTMQDVLVASILSSLSLGAFAVLILILFLLPGVLALLDPILKARRNFFKI